MGSNVGGGGQIKQPENHKIPHALFTPKLTGLYIICSCVIECMIQSPLHSHLSLPLPLLAREKNAINTVCSFRFFRELNCSINNYTLWWYNNRIRKKHGKRTSYIGLYSTQINTNFNAKLADNTICKVQPA